MRLQKYVVVRRHADHERGDIEEWNEGNDFVPKPGGTLYDNEREAEDVRSIVACGDDVIVIPVYR